VRVVACVAAVPVLLAGWLWLGDRAIERKLGPVASEIAGREVRVDCQGLFGSLLDAQAREGEVSFDASGRPEPRLFLTRRTCKQLKAFSGRAYHGELDCLRGVDWSAPAAIMPDSSCYAESSATVYALLVLAHEAYHTAGVANEATTNCYAIQSMAYAATRLGGSEEEGRLAALAMAALEPYQGGEYASHECVAGGKLDLWPETPSFPTEAPLRPARGRGGAVGVASGAV
jgi:hypothetical protein